MHRVELVLNDCHRDYSRRNGNELAELLNQMSAGLGVPSQEVASS